MGEEILSQIVSSALVGFLYMLVVTLATLSSKQVYEDKIKLSLKNSNTQRWSATIIIFFILSLIMPTLLFTMFWNPRNQNIDPLILNIVGVILAAIIAHLVYHCMKNLTIKSAESKHGK